MIESVANKSRAAEVLLLEDNYGDVILAKKAFSGRMDVNITVAANGEEAISILRQEGKYESTPRPDLILLDLNLPRKAGQEVLQEIKSNPQWCTIPVIILTSSMREHDVVSTYNLNANAYLVKPNTIDQFSQIAKAIEDFWLSSAILLDQQDIKPLQ